MAIPKVSLVFTSFNHREYLTQALDALLGQTFRDFELIIVDDCSTDGSQQILQEYASRDSRIRLFLNEYNSGNYVYSTNQGFTYAKAPYIVFAQCDDYAETTQLERMVKILDCRHEVGVVFCASRMVDERGLVLGEDYDVREKVFRNECIADTFIPGVQMRYYLLHSCTIPNLSAAMIRRELFERYGGLSNRYLVLADWDFWLKTTLETDFYYLREPLNNFRQHRTTIRASIKIKRQIEELLQMYYDFFRLSNMRFKDSWRWKNRIARIWLDYYTQGVKAWFGALFPLLRVSVGYDFYLPLLLVLQVGRGMVQGIGHKIGIVK